MAKTYSINLDLKYVPISINFTEGKEPVTIRFNPADDGLPRRLMESEKMIKDKLAELGGGINLTDESGNPDPDKYVELQKAKDKVIFDAVDYAFGNAISAEVFKYCSPMAIVGGEYFIEQFLTRITPVIKNIIEAENKKATTADRKYYSKYKK